MTDFKQQLILLIMSNIKDIIPKIEPYQVVKYLSDYGYKHKLPDPDIDITGMIELQTLYVSVYCHNIANTIINLCHYQPVREENN